eukprot:SAG31_NODE_42_length_31262_cov_46.416231_19_plen_75_part_00
MRSWREPGQQCLDVSVEIMWTRINRVGADMENMLIQLHPALLRQWFPVVRDELGEASGDLCEGLLVLRARTHEQ